MLFVKLFPTSNFSFLYVGQNQNVFMNDKSREETNKGHSAVLCLRDAIFSEVGVYFQLTTMSSQPSPLLGKEDPSHPSVLKAPLGLLYPRGHLLRN